MRPYLRRLLSSGLLIFAIVLVVLQWPSSSGARDRYLKLQLFAKVLNLVQQYYVDEVDTQKLIYGGIKGILQELDPHTNFLPPTLYKEFVSETSGKFGGLGIEITLQDGILTIISPIEDTPAWKAGLKAGDKIISIDGKSTKGMSLAESAQLMKGDKGQKIKLGIARESFETSKDFTITRAAINIRSVKMTDLGEGYGYIRLTSFIENSAKDFEKALQQLERKKGNLSGLILDMRRNPGGLLDQAIKISDFFIDEGTIVSTVGRKKSQKKVVKATKENSRIGFPMVVLINEYSASASEIVAGALKDNKRALVMGKRSFGKGSVQSVVTMGDGSGLKLTVARYFTPSGVSIQATGITPDVVVDEVDSAGFQKAIIKRNVRRESDMKGHLVGEGEGAHAKLGKTSTKKKANLLDWWRASKNDKGHLVKGKAAKLLDDYQVLQAYNYLRAYKVMKEL